MLLKTDSDTGYFQWNLQNSYEHLFIERPCPPVDAYIFCKDFVKISYENSYTHTRRFYVAAVYLFLKYNFILVCAMSFYGWWGT